MIDAHCHLMDISRTEINKDFFRLRNIVNSAYCLSSSKISIEMKKKWADFLFSTTGIAPQRSMEDISNEMRELHSLVESENKFIDAVGEIGLDYHWGDTESKRKHQKLNFQKQIEIAKEYQKPIIIHSRESTLDCIKYLSGFEHGVMFHFYSGDVEEAKDICDRGWLISIPPLKGRMRKKVIEKTPIENLVCETDAPFVGKTPLDVEKSIEIVSEIKGIEKEEVTSHTSLNVLSLLNKK